MENVKKGETKTGGKEGKWENDRKEKQKGKREERRGEGRGRYVRVRHIEYMAGLCLLKEP